MYYLIGMSESGRTYAGNTGTLICHSVHMPTVRKWAARFQAMYNHSTIYALRGCLYTQSVCEMNCIDFTAYVQRFGVLVA